MTIFDGTVPGFSLASPRSCTMGMIYKVSVERCIACGKCELACAFAHGSEGRPAKTRINIHRRGPELGHADRLLPVRRRGLCRGLPDRGAGAQRGDRRHRHGAVALHLLPDVRRRLSLRQHAVGRDLHCVQKCDLCGGDPRCVPFCPTGAIAWVPVEEAAIRPEPLDRETLACEGGDLIGRGRR